MTSLHLKRPATGVYPLKMEQAPLVLRSIIFDCDGVLIDSEPLHFSAFKKTLGVDGNTLSEETYKERYLALDDKGSITKFFADSKKMLSLQELNELLNKKTEIYQELIKSEGILAYPAVPEFIMALAQHYPLAIASGSRRHELELVLEAAGIRQYFEAIISADDVQNGKPNPESYLKAIEALNHTGKRPTPIKPEECIVIEDSKDGVQSAHAAKMKCVAVATSFPPFELSHADLVVPSLAALKMSQLEDLFHGPTPAPKPVPSIQPN